LRDFLKKRLEKEWASQEEQSGGLCRALERKRLKPLVKEDPCALLHLFLNITASSKKENNKFRMGS
jgi:hypothetical protein